MATSNLYVHHAASITTFSVGLLGIGGGIYGLLRPVPFSTMLGVPIESSASTSTPTSKLTTTAQTLSFISFIAARNVGSGIATIALLLTDQRTAAGYVMLAGSVTALADAWICKAYGVAAEGKALGHAVTAGVIMTVGAVLVLGRTTGNGVSRVS